MNSLKQEKKIAAISALVEGNSIRSTERMTGIYRDTIMRLLVEVGAGCERIMDQSTRNLKCERIQVDEICGYVAKKQATVTVKDDPLTTGDAWTFVALDADTKLVPCYRIGKRTKDNTRAFVSDLASRLENKVQPSSDGLKHYIAAVELAFGGAVDYGQIVKSYEAEALGPGRYSPPKVVAVDRIPMQGEPDFRHISTSYIERQNLTMRMQVRRLTRLTKAFSKKLDNLKAAVALHFVHHNYVRIHKTLRMTPAMAAGVANNLWSLDELIVTAQEAAK